MRNPLPAHAKPIPKIGDVSTRQLWPVAGLASGQRRHNLDEIITFQWLVTKLGVAVIAQSELVVFHDRETLVDPDAFSNTVPEGQ
jgi:hypothetical protein